MKSLGVVIASCLLAIAPTCIAREIPIENTEVIEILPPECDQNTGNGCCPLETKGVYGDPVLAALDCVPGEDG